MSNIFQSKRALRIYGAGILGVTALCVILRIICMTFFFDSDIGYYDKGAALPIILNILLFLAAAVSLILCLVPKIKLSPVPPTPTKATRMCAIFPAAGFAAYAVIYFSLLAEYSSLYGTLPFAYILTAIATVGACAFFALYAFRKNNGDILFVLTGVLAVIWFVVALAECYFDTLVQMNSPNKLIFEFATLGAMLLTVNEIRQGFEFKRPAFHLFSASVATLFLLTDSVPSIIFSIMGKMPRSYSLLYSDAVLLLLAVLAVARLLNMCFGKEEEAVCESCEEDIPDECTDTDAAEDAESTENTDEQTVEQTEEISTEESTD